MKQNGMMHGLANGKMVFGLDEKLVLDKVKL